MRKIKDNFTINNFVSLVTLFRSLVRDFLLNNTFMLFYFPKAEEYDLALVRTDGIGDYIVWLDSLNEYKKAYKGKKIMLICIKEVESIALLDDFYSSVISLDNRSFKNIFFRFDFFRKLRKYSFKTVINPTYSRAFDSDNIVSVLRADEKIAYYGNNSNLYPWVKSLYNQYYTTLLSNPLNDSIEIYNNEFFIKQLFNKDFSASIPSFPNFIRSSKFDNLLVNNYCVFFLSARKFRAWDITNFIELSNSLISKFDIVLLGAGTNDELLSAEFIRGSKDRTRVFNLINETTMVETAQIVSNSKFVIGNDSVGVHLATSLRVPSICIAPGAHYGRFVPYPSELPNKFYHPRVVVYKMSCFGCDYRCIKPILNQYECVRKINFELVKQEVECLLAELN